MTTNPNSILSTAIPVDGNGRKVDGAIMAKAGQYRRYTLSIPEPTGSEPVPSNITPYSLASLLGWADPYGMSITLVSWTLLNYGDSPITYGDENVAEGPSSVLPAAEGGVPSTMTSTDTDPSSIYLLLDPSGSYDLVMELVGGNIPVQSILS